jgi:hypothetical protein
MKKLIITLSIIVISAGCYIGNKIFKDPDNKDHTAKVVSVQYVPNGRDLGKSACTCVDKQGRYYNRLESDILYQGDIIYINKHHNLIECILLGIGFCALIVVILLLGSSRSMYAGGYDFFVYGIKGVFNLIIDRRWGAFCGGGRR